MHQAMGARPALLPSTQHCSYLNAPKIAPRRLGRTSIRCLERNSSKSESKEEPSLVLRGAWALAEAGGNIRAQLFGSDSKQQAPPDQKVHISREDAVDAIREDYEVNYFVSGKGRLAAYDPNCRFADDFAAFNGVDRFRNNVSNLGGLTCCSNNPLNRTLTTDELDDSFLDFFCPLLKLDIDNRSEDVKLETSSWDQTDDSLKVSWRFSAVVTIPWRPRLAAAGATTYVFDATTGLVTDHVEEWNVEPKKVFQQLLRPATVPSDSSSPWERFMWHLSKGKALEAWAVVSQPALLAGGAVLGASLLLHATGVDASLPVRFLWGSVAKPFPNGLPTRLLLSGNDSYSSENDNH